MPCTVATEPPPAVDAAGPPRPRAMRSGKDGSPPRPSGRAPATAATSPSLTTARGAPPEREEEEEEEATRSMDPDAAPRAVRRFLQRAGTTSRSGPRVVQRGVGPMVSPGAPNVAQPRSHGPEEGSIPPLPPQERSPYRITRSGKRGRQRYKTKGTVYLPAMTVPPTVVALRPQKGGNRCGGPIPLIGIGSRRRPTNATKYNTRQVLKSDTYRRGGWQLPGCA